jgi:hypothetical protein
VKVQVLPLRAAVLLSVSRKLCWAGKPAPTFAYGYELKIGGANIQPFQG